MSVCICSTNAHVSEMVLAYRQEEPSAHRETESVTPTRRKREQVGEETEMMCTILTRGVA